MDSGRSFKLFKEESIVIKSCHVRENYAANSSLFPVFNTACSLNPDASAVQCLLFLYLSPAQEFKPKEKSRPQEPSHQSPSSA